MPTILVLGAGSIGKRHIRNLLSTGLAGEDISVVEPRADRQGETVELGIPASNVFASREEAMEARRYDSAIVATPSSMHYVDAIALASAGVNLMIEKPLDVDLSRYDELAAAVSESGVFAFVAYCFRFDPLAQKFGELLSAGTVGELLYARAEMSTYLPAWHPWEDYREFYMAKKALGGGTLLDQSHLFDMTRMFLGEVRGVTGVSTKLSELEIETDDFGELVVELERGIYVSIHIDLFTKVSREFYQVTGDQGTLEWNITDRYVTLFKEDGTSEVLARQEDYNQMYMNEIAYFLDRIDPDKEVEGPTMEDGKRAMDVVCGVRASNLREFIDLT